MTETRSLHWPAVSTLARSDAQSLASPRVMEAVTRFAAVLCLFTLATVLIFWPCIAHLHTALIGPPEDNMNDFWNSWYAVVGRDPAHFFFTRLLRFPEGTSLIYQSFAYPQVFAVVVLSRGSGTDMGTLVALQNITLLASFPLAGVGAFYLVRHLAQSTVGGLIGGFVFAFNPSHVAHALHHAGVASIEFLPFFVLAYLLALDRRSAVWLGIAAVFYALSALSCWYYLFYCAYFIGFHLLYLRVRDHAWPRGWNLTAPAFCLVSTLAILSPLIVPMVMLARPSVYDGGGNTLVADLLGYFAFPPEHLLSSLSRGLRFTGYPWESTVYLGLVNLAVLGWLWLRTGFARTSPLFYVAFGMLTFCILASGEALHVDGMVTPLHLPDAALDKLPFFANVRAPSRAIVFVYLFLGMGIGSAAAAALRHRHFASKAGVAAMAALIALDFYPANLAATPVACPSGLTVLKTDPDRGFGVLNLPLSYADADSYMLEQACHGRPLVDGITSREMATTLINRLSFGDVPTQREQLIRAHVKYILVHRPRNGLYAWSKELPPVAQFRKNYRAAYDGPDMIVLRVY
ncbi:MAG TPA: hypothetical protein VNX86_17860 [Rhizomicrobium sp.]|nr:hypothetical protein [Rhizomicrobium sp.]